MRSTLALLAAAATLIARPGAAGSQRFRSGVEVVRVDVLVSDRGRPVTGLSTADFEVHDNGVRQDVTHVDVERVTVDVVLVLDLSASVSGERLEHLQQAGRALVERLHPNDRAGIVSFSHLIRLESGLTRDRGRLLQVLDVATPRGASALVDATYAGMLMGESDAGRTLVLVLSDGLDVSSWLTPGRVIDAAKRLNTVVYGVTMRNARARFLDALTQQTGGRLLAVDERDLSATFVRVLDEFRQRYLLTYSPRGVTRGGWHTLKVAVKRRGVTVRARPGYFADRR